MVLGLSPMVHHTDQQRGELVFLLQASKVFSQRNLLNAFMLDEAALWGRLGLTFAKLHVMPIETSRLYKFFFFGIGFQSYHGVNHGIDHRR